MQIKVNIFMYLIDLETGIESIFSECMLKIGEVYMFQPLSMWLSLHDPDKVSILSAAKMLNVLFANVLVS